MVNIKYGLCLEILSIIVDAICNPIWSLSELTGLLLGLNMKPQISVIDLVYKSLQHAKKSLTVVKT